MSIEQAAYVARIRSELAQARGELAQAQDELAVIGKLAQAKQLHLHACAYCGYQYLLGSKLTEHIESCPEHPLAKVKTELAQARAELDHIYMVATRRNIELTQALNERDEAEAEFDRMRQAAQNQSAEVQELWLSPCEGEGLRRQLAEAVVAQADAELAAHVHDKACGELAQTVRTERQLRQEAEQELRQRQRQIDLLSGAELRAHQAGRRTENLQQEKVSVHEALDKCQIPRNYDDGKPASTRTRIFWLNQRAERAEALAALVTPELALLLEQLADGRLDGDKVIWWGDAQAAARALAAQIKGALDEC